MDELSKTLCSSSYAKDNGVLLYNNDVYIREDTPALALLEVRRVLGRAFVPVTVTPEAFDEMLAKIWQQSSGVSQQLVDDMDADIDLMALTEEIPDNEDLLDNDENSPVIRLINAILGEAVKDGASDIHIETFERTLSIRFRVDGVLRPVLQPARKLAPLLVSRIKVMSKLDIAEKRLPQDGRISLRIGRKAIDVRVSTIPSQYGERVVMRLLDKSNLKPDINKLGLIDEELEKLKGLIERPHGIILVTGPTGSGKSTTLYAILSALSQQQLRWAMQAQEKVVKDRLQNDASGESKPLDPEGDWHQPLETQGEDYTVVSQVDDAQDCFNVNNLLAADKVAQDQNASTVPEKPRKEKIVEQILTDGGISQTAAEEIYQQLVDYLDGDATTVKEGAEMDAWSGVVPARQPANQMMRTLAEIKLLPAFPAAAYPKVSKLLCALPDSASKVDVNTLTPEQAPLLAALFPGKLTADDAVRLIESRPETGWESMDVFSKALEQAFPQLKDELPQVAGLLSINSRYFRVNYTGNTDELTLRVVSQLQVNNEAGEIVTWQRRYRMIE